MFRRPKTALHSRALFLPLGVFEGHKARLYTVGHAHPLPTSRPAACRSADRLRLWLPALRHQPKLVNQNTAKVPAVQRGLDGGQWVNRRHSNRICL